MKGILFDIKRFAVHDGDGIRTTVLFKGCPLDCVWCHNPEGIGFSPQLAYYENKCMHCGECVGACPNAAHTVRDGRHHLDRRSCAACGKCADVCLGEALTLYGKSVTVDELMPQLTEDRMFYETSGGGVTLSGGECLMQSEFCAALLKELKKEGLHTAVDTCGYVPREAIDRVLPYTDQFLYDIKAIDPEVHRRCTGVTNERILDNLRYLDAVGAAVEVRIPFVPGYNADEIAAIGAFLCTLRHPVRARILPYHNYAGSKYAALGRENTLPERLPTPAELAAAACALGLEV